MKNRRLMGLLLLTGLLAGTLGGLVGLGGGVVMVPLLVLWTPLTRHQVHATSLAAVIATGSVGALAYASKGRVNIPATLVLAAAAAAAAALGVRAAHRTHPERLKRVFAGFLLTVALLLAARPWLRHVVPGHDFHLTAASVAALAGTGLLSGFVAGLLGIGGGSLIVPGLVLLVGMDQHLAQGTSLLGLVPAAVAGTWTHARIGTFVPRVLPPLILGIVAGAAIGGLLAQVLPELALRVVFVAFLAWLGIRDLRR